MAGAGGVLKSPRRLPHVVAAPTFAKECEYYGEFFTDHR
jgi:hypothetical protein